MWTAAALIAKVIWKLLVDLPTPLKFMLVLLLAVVGPPWYTERTTRAEVTAYYKAQIKKINDAADRAAEYQEQEQATIIGGLRAALEQALQQKQQTITIVKEVTKYVTVEADAHCVIPRGFVWLHDKSLAGENPDVPGSDPGDVDAATDFKLSEVATVTGNNNAECVARGQIIKAWQDWYAKEKRTFEKAQSMIRDAVAQ